MESPYRKPADVIVLPTSYLPPLVPFNPWNGSGLDGTVPKQPDNRWVYGEQNSKGIYWGGPWEWQGPHGISE